MTSPAYRGRFAPSPTGPLHFGSLVAAVASHADARHQNGSWLVRIDDVDQTRCRPDAEDQILRTLQTFGMHSDQAPIRQSGRAARYLEVLEQLNRQGQVYRCNCSRKVIAAIAGIGSEGPIYPGTCRSNPPRRTMPSHGGSASARRRSAFTIGSSAASARTWPRISATLWSIASMASPRISWPWWWTILIRALRMSCVVPTSYGRRRVRSGCKSCWAFRSHAMRTSPWSMRKDGHKLSKRDAAHPVDEREPVRSLIAAWTHLGQAIPTEPLGTSTEFWDWAIPRWQLGRVPHDRNTRNERTDAV